MSEPPGPPRRLVYVGAFRFPEGDAAAARVLGIGRALRQAGFDLAFAGGESAGRPEDTRPDGSLVYDGFPYHPQAELDGPGRSPGARLARYLAMGRRTARWLAAQFAGDRPPDGVILYNGLAGYHRRLGTLCRRFRVPLVADLTEWYSPHQCTGGRFGLQRWDVAYTMRRLVPRADAILPISRWLAETYRRRGCRVLRVPPLVDLEAPKWQVPPKPTHRPGLELIYAGVPGRKDALATILAGFARALPDHPDLRLRLLGLTPESLADYCARNGIDRSRLGAAVEALGRLPQSAVPAHLAAADYGVLLRPDARYARAGFPTKVVEYLSAGTAVIANPVGDLGEFVVDAAEGLLVPTDSPEAFLGGIQRALEGGRALALRTGAAARRRAAASFDYRNHVQSLGEFLRATLATPPPPR